jgi:hypothetical protein
MPTYSLKDPADVGNPSLPKVNTSFMDNSVVPQVKTTAEIETTLAENVQHNNTMAQASWFEGVSWDGWVDSKENPLGDKYKAFAATHDNTILSKAMFYLDYDMGIFQEEDEEFKKNMTATSYEMVAQVNGLPASDAVYLAERAQNAQHMNSLVAGLKEQQARRELVSSVLTNKQALVSSLATGLTADIDAFVGGAVMSGAKIGSQLGKATYAVNKARNVSKVDAIAKAKMVEARTTQIINAGASAVEAVAYTAGIEADKDSTAGELLMEAMIAGSVAAGRAYVAQKNIARVQSRYYGGQKTTGEAGKIVDEANAVRKAEREAEEASNTRRDTEGVETKVEPTNTRGKGEYKNVAREYYNAVDEGVYDADSLVKMRDRLDGLVNVSKKKIDDLKAKIDNRIVIAKSSVSSDIFKRIDAKKSELADAMKNTAKNGVRIERINDELAMMKKEADDLELLSEHVRTNITDIKRDIRTAMDTDDALKKDMAELYEEMYASGLINKSEIDQLRYALANPKKQNNAKLTSMADKLKEQIKNNPKKTIAIGALAVPTIASADAGDAVADNPVQSLFLLGVLAAGAYGGAKAFRSGALKDMVEKVKRSEMVENNLERTRETRVKVEKIASKTRTRITETLLPIRKGGGKEWNDFIDKFYFDPVKGVGNMDMNKRQVFNSYEVKMRRDYNAIYKEFQKEQGVSFMDEMSTLIFSSQSNMSKFNRMVRENIETGGTAYADSEAVLKASAHVRSTMDELMNEMIESGVKGAKDAKKLKDYVPRVIRSENMTELYLSANESGKKAIVNTIANMLPAGMDAEKAGKRLKVAEAYLDMIVTPRSVKMQKFSKIEDIKKYVKEKGLPEEMVDDIADIAGVDGEIFGRLEKRIPMYKSSFPKDGVKITRADGSTVVFKQEDMFEHDILSVYNSLLNRASGEISLARVFGGGTGVDDIRGMIIDNAPTKRAQDIALKDLELYMGRGVIDYADSTNSLMRDIGNYTVFAKMWFSITSLAMEAVTTVAHLGGSGKGGWRVALQGLSGKLRAKYGKNSELMRQLQDVFGEGGHSYNRSFGQFNTYDDSAQLAGKAGDHFSRVGEMGRDFVLHTLPFVRTSDFLQQIHMVDVMQNLAEWSKGNKKFMDYELQAFGLNDDIKRIVSKLQLDKDGILEKVDMEGWSYKDKVKLSEVANLMLIKRINQARSGTTGAWSRHSALGVTMSTLLKFPMSAYSNLGTHMGIGMMHGDPHAYIQTSAWLGGAMLSSMLRHEIKGEEYDTEDLMIEAIMSHPFAGAYGTMLGVASPAPYDTTGTVADAMNAYNWK